MAQHDGTSQPVSAGQPPRNGRWRRVARFALVAVAALAVVVGLAVAGLLVGANTGPGRRFLVRQTAALTGGTVVIDGLSGRFPDRFRLARLDIRDTQGVWLSLRDIHLDWSPLALLGRTARINAFTAAELDMARLPVSSEPARATSSQGSSSSLKLGVDIRHLAVERIAVGAPIAGQAASFSVSGHGRISNIDPVLNGLSLPSLPRSDIALAVRRLDRAGQIALQTATGKGNLTLHLDASEGADGFLVSRLAMPQLAPLALRLDLKGPIAASALAFDARAGAVTAHMAGVLDLPSSRMARLDAGIDAPAMTLTPDIGWKSVHFLAHLSGQMTAPRGTADLDVSQLVAAAVNIGALKGHFTGDGGTTPAAELLHLVLSADGLRLPGKAPTLLAQAPLVLDARLAPAQPGAPLDFTLSHPVLGLNGSVRTQAPQQATLALKLPDLLPIGEAVGVALRGQGGMTLRVQRPAQQVGATQLGVDGTVSLTGGQPQAVGLIGTEGRFATTATITPLPAQGATASGQRIDISTLSVDGHALHIKGQGRLSTGRDMDLSLSLALPDLSRAMPFLRGPLTMAVTAKGPVQDFAANVHAQASPGTATMPQGDLVLDAAAQHLPGAPQGSLDLHGTLDRNPLKLAATFSQNAAGERALALTDLSWNSVQGHATLTQHVGEILPLGTLDLSIARLADFRSLLGQPLGGRLVASVRTAQDGTVPVVSLRLDGNVALPAASIGSLALAGTVRDPSAHPDADLTLRLGGVNAYGVKGQARLGAKGPENAMALSMQVGPASWSGSPLALDAAALLDLPARQVRVQKLTATAREETLRVLAPALVSFGDEMGVDRLRATLGVKGSAPATLDIAGRIKPALALTADVRNVTPALARPFVPGLEAQGVVTASARLSGTLAQPVGNVQLTGRGLRMSGSSAAASVPALTLDASAVLSGNAAKVQAQAAGGPKLALQVNGTAPLGEGGALNLRVGGRLDLSIANGVLGVQARQAAGQAQMDLLVAGKLASPVVTGTLDLRDADFQDFAQGVHLAQINGRVVGERDRLVIQNLTARAGEGTVGLTGSVGVFAPGLPVDLRLQARKARPVSSDLLTAVLNADVSVTGQASTRIDVAGTVNLSQVDINIPNSLPTSVARLDVIWPGDEKKKEEEARAASTHAMVVGLNLRVVSPGKFFVRGHGLDAEMAGRLLVGGTAQAAQVSGGFDLKRGNFNLAGISLNFTKGRVAFTGSGVDHQLDPTLDFEADRVVNGETAMLKVGGYASSPRITFESLPPLPQDQVLAMLIFGTDAHSLSSTQMIEIGTAVATLTGLTPFDPMGTLRKTLHLDRLSISGGSGVGNGGTSVEAGKYVMKGVYVGAKQATSGSGTQAQVQVDLTHQLKLNTTVGTGGTVTGFTTPENDPGSSVGLLWQHRY
ncbi:MAG: translocation/assembly module TamB domain-containing protein [Acetobacter sp.]|uniref:translocation/assembly module TamB domain-containing protein n=1 Tax=Acetobacter sp. TaxID=440 RepID=UPI0039EC5662